MRISPSILSANFGCMRESIEQCEKAGVDSYHIDVMDGHFVPNLTFGPVVIKTVRDMTERPLIAHLMVSNPEKTYDMYLSAGADVIVPHVEVLSSFPWNTDDVKTGIAINPETPVEKVLPLLDSVHHVLVMSVHPGFSGQKFIHDVIPKIKRLREFIDKEGLSAEIHVDGGINPETGKLVKEAGADVLVAASAVFRGDVERNISALKML